MAALARFAAAGMMSRPVEEMLRSIMDEFAAAKNRQDAIEAKSLFRLLNYCPRPAFNSGETYQPLNDDPIIE